MVVVGLGFGVAEIDGSFLCNIEALEVEFKGFGNDQEFWNKV